MIAAEEGSEKEAELIAHRVASDVARIAKNIEILCQRLKEFKILLKKSLF